MLRTAFATGFLLLWNCALAFAVDNPEGVAVIIGNKGYQGRVPEVSYAHRDADAMRNYILNVLGYDPDNVIDLRDATQAQMQSVFGNERDHKGLVWQYIDPEGTSDVTVFYSGHGVPGQHDGRGYLLPVNANPNTAEINGYPIDLMYKNLEKLKVASVTVMLDACFSGDSNNGMLIQSASPVFVKSQMPESLENMTVLTAASGSQLASWDEKAEHGLFTKHLLDALYGAGDKNSDGVVTAREVKGYLDKKMTRAARRHYRRVQEASFDGQSDRVLSRAVEGQYPKRSDGVAGKTAAAAPQPNGVAVEARNENLFSLKRSNIRSKPDIQGKKLGQLKIGEAVNVTGKAGEWYRIALAGGKSGYVLGSLLGESNPETIPDPRVDKMEHAYQKIGRNPWLARGFLRNYPNSEYADEIRSRVYYLLVEQTTRDVRGDGKVFVNRSINKYDADGRLVSNQFTYGGYRSEESYQYNALGLKTSTRSVDLDNGKITMTRYRYDSKGNPVVTTVKTDGNLTTVTKTFDKNGNETASESISSNGSRHTETFEYDHLGNILKTASHHSNGDWSRSQFWYDSAGNNIRYLSMDSNDWRYEINSEYDGQGNMIVSRTNYGDDDWNLETIRYDTHGNRLSSKVESSNGSVETTEFIYTQRKIIFP